MIVSKQIYLNFIVGRGVFYEAPFFGGPDDYGGISFDPSNR